jgi:hypothetical protein
MPHDGSNPKQNRNLDWFGKIQSDIANSAAGSKALAQQVANLNTSMKLGTSPYIDFKNSGVMQASAKRKQPQTLHPLFRKCTMTKLSKLSKQYEAVWILESALQHWNR